MTTPSTLRQAIPFVDAMMRITRDWWPIFSNLMQLAAQFCQQRPASPIVAQYTGASPYAYTAPYNGFAIISAGPIVSVTYYRLGNATAYPTNQTYGMFPMSQGDILNVATSGAPPTLTFFPT